MGAFDTLAIANTALGAHQTWLDAVADNIANVNTIEPTSAKAFQATYVVFQPRQDGGVDVAGYAKGDPAGRVINSPDNPLADAQGNVRAPDVDRSVAMGQLVMAQRGFPASVQVTKTAQDTYASALQIGEK